MLKTTLSVLFVSLFVTSNAIAGKCSNAIDEVSKYEAHQAGYVYAVDMAVDQCIVEAQDKTLPSVVQQIFNDTDLCSDTAKNQQLSDSFTAQCQLKAVKLSSWIIKHSH